ncbi:MAG: PilW family protein [Gammaproteobacteria bacterium]|nr:PilW family protein [Gammaproteobacteria bacterium]
MTSTKHRNIALVARKFWQSGFTLVEIMIALTISLIILLAVTQIFVSSRTTYSYTEGMSRIQEGGRFAIDFLARDIRMAGYTGCARRLETADVTNILKNPNDATRYDSAGMEVYRYTGSGGSALSDWTPALKDIASGGYFKAGEMEPFSDLLIVKYGTSVDAYPTGSAAPNANIQILATTETESAFRQNDIVMVTDCNNADIFAITNNVANNGGALTLAHATGSNSTNRLGHGYTTNAEVLRWEARAYYVGKPDLDGDNKPDPDPALMRKSLVRGDLVAQALVEGVERMQLMLGMDTDTAPGRFRDNGANQYVLPGDAAAADLSKVVSIRVGIAVTSGDTVDGEADTTVYNILGLANESFDDYGPGSSPENYGSENRARRRVFTMTVARRN